MSLNLKNSPLTNQDFSKDTISFSRKFIYLKKDTSRCTRCGACLAACISYKTLNMENFSPRGRWQLLNFLLERKIDIKENEPMLLKCINSCTQCGRCSQVCAADLKTENFIFELKNYFKKSSSRANYLKFYQKYAALLFPFFILGKKIKQSKKSEVKNLLLTSKAGLKFAAFSLDSLPFSRISKQAVYLNEALYKGDKDLLALMLKNLKREVKTFGKINLWTDNIILWRFLKDKSCFKKLNLVLPFTEQAKTKDNIYIISNNSFESSEENSLLSCLNANFFVEFTQDLIHTPANLFWRALSCQEEQAFAYGLKKYQGKKLIALCAEDKIFFERIAKKHKLKVEILMLSQIANGRNRTED